MRANFGPMRLPAGRSSRVRTTALVLAVGVNALYLLPLLSGRAKTLPEPVSPAMLWIVAALEPRPPARRSVALREPRPLDVVAPAAGIPLVVAPPVPEAVPEPQPEPDQEGAMKAPPLGGSAAAADAARDYVRKQELEKLMSSLDDKPKVLQLPGPPRHKKGQIEHLEGGVVREWVSDLCFYERNLLIQQGAARSVCKLRTAAERLSTDLAEALEEAVKPKYLGGRRSLPKPEDVDPRIP